MEGAKAQIKLYTDRANDSKFTKPSHWLQVPETVMLWLASAITVGLGRAVKIEKSRKRDLAARLTSTIMASVSTDMTTTA